jgi:hypothetical protein
MKKIATMMLGILGAAALVGAPSVVYASEQSAMAGHGWPNHFDSCFTSSFALMANSCSGTVGSTHLLIVPAQVGPSGTYRVFARATGNGSNGATDCQALAIASNGGGFSFSQIVSTNASKAVQLLTLGSVSVPGGGTLHFECHVAQGGGQVINVEFD